jgi:hypothetical protein
MAVLPTRHDKPRRAPSEPPNNFIGLVWGITGDRERTDNLNRIVINLALAVGLVCCVAIYAFVAAVKGIHGLTLPTLVPGGLLGGASLTYATIRIANRLRHRRDGAEPIGKQTTRRSPGPSRKQVRRGQTPSRAQNSIPRSGRPRRR